MIKNIFKSIAWLFLSGLIFILSIFTTYILYIPRGFQNQTSVITTAILIFCISIIAIFIFYKLIRKHSFDIKKIKFKEITFSFLMGTILCGIYSILYKMFSTTLFDFSFLKNANIQTSEILTLLIIVPLLYFVVEIIFRYGICGTIARSNSKVGLIISTITMLLLFFSTNIIDIIYILLLSLLTGLIYLKYQNIWYSFAIHIGYVFNLSLNIMLNTIWIPLGCSLLSIILLYFLIKKDSNLKDFSFLKKSNILED